MYNVTTRQRHEYLAIQPSIVSEVHDNMEGLTKQQIKTNSLEDTQIWNKKVWLYS